MGLFGFFWNQQGGAKYKDAASTYTRAHICTCTHTLLSFYIYRCMYYCLPFSESLCSCREYRWIDDTHAHKHIHSYIPGFIKALGKFFRILRLYQTTI